MSFERKKKIRLRDGREVWMYSFVRYKDVASGKFISREELGEDPALGYGEKMPPDLDEIEDQILSTLTEIAANPELAVKSSSSIRMLLGMVEKMKRKAVEPRSEEWFILGRDLAKEVLEMLDEDDLSNSCSIPE